MIFLFGYHFVSGHTAGNSQLILGRENAILIDCSLPFCAEETIKKLKAALNGRTLDAILLSHSHYDHIAALPQIAADHACSFLPKRIILRTTGAMIIARRSSTFASRKISSVT